MKQFNYPSTPKWAVRFFHWYCNDHLSEAVLGDMLELYDRRRKNFGKRKADLLFLWNVLCFLQPFALKKYKPVMNTNMYQSYLKIGWRNLLRNKGYSFINIGGLALGITIALLVGLWIYDEITFDHYYKNHHELAEVMVRQTIEGHIYTGPTVAPPLEEGLKAKYGSDFKSTSLVSWEEDYMISAGEARLSATGIWVEETFPEMFTLDMLSGKGKSLEDHSHILISNSLAKALFPSSEALNQSVRVNNELDFLVGGVYEDMPRNTTFGSSRILFPWKHPTNYMNRSTDWDNHECTLFVQLVNPSQVSGVSEKVKNLPTSYIKDWLEEIMIHPLDQLHLYNEFTNGKADGGRIQFVWLFGLIGMFVLLLACINFMNLSTARSEKRAKEVGIRKAIGSIQSQLIGQFLLEAVLVALVASLLSLILVQLSLPFFNTLADKQITMPWTNLWFWLMLSGFTLSAGILSGSYPAFYLSSFKPVKVLKGSFKAGRFAALPRKILVVSQFTISVTLVICTFMVFKQIQFAKDRPAGYTRNSLITIWMNTPELRKKNEILRNELLATDVVENMAISTHSPAGFHSNTTITWQGKDPAEQEFFRDLSVTPEFGATIHWTIMAGRDFSRNQNDSSSVIINETAAAKMKGKNPLGETVFHADKAYTIIGVVKDMVSRSPFERIEPSIFFMGARLNVITLRIKSDAPFHEALATIESIFKKYNPNVPFEYNFVDDEFKRRFSDEERIGSLASLLSSLAVFVSCLGLFGLASFMAEQRTKEISIRKIMGASIPNVWMLLSKDFISLVIVSCAIAVPVSLFYVTSWLQQYTYHTTPSWYVFVIVSGGAILITLLTVSFQSVKAALTNPSQSLRSE